VQNRNARLIIPTVLIFWLLSLVVFTPRTPEWIEGLFGFGFVLAILLLVFYLMAETGWRALARNYPAIVPFTGIWQTCPTGHMAPVSVSDPEYERRKGRFVGALRIGTTTEMLYLSTFFSQIPLLKQFFPPLQIPWSAVTQARLYDAPGWVAPPSKPGTLVQITYDPGYTGKFVEIQVGQPPVFIQLPANLLGDGVSRLPFRANGSV